LPVKGKEKTSAQDEGFFFREDVRLVPEINNYRRFLAAFLVVFFLAAFLFFAAI
jgi:hypothetical protein